MKTLLAGPWLSEFGWELMTWIPAIRARSRKYDRIVCVCKTGHNYLYEDFADIILNYDKKGLSDRWLLNGKSVKLPKKFIEMFPKADVITPRKSVCNEWKREYCKYSRSYEIEGYDLIIHARACKKYDQQRWNWPVKNYIKLVELLNLKKICCIGTDAYYVGGTKDLRGIDIEDLCDVLASSKVMLSPSSGPAHLASLCQCPHVVMTDNSYQKSVKGTNKDRYKKIWNPFFTSCKVLDKHNWQPPVSVVAKALEKFL
jgi:hypothetical protein